MYNNLFVSNYYVLHCFWMVLVVVCNTPEYTTMFLFVKVFFVILRSILQCFCLLKFFLVSLHGD